MSQPTNQPTRVGQSRAGHVAGSERRTGPGAGRTGSIRSRQGGRGRGEGGREIEEREREREERGERRETRLGWTKQRNKEREKERKKEELHCYRAPNAIAASPTPLAPRSKHFAISACSDTLVRRSAVPDLAGNRPEDARFACEIGWGEPRIRGAGRGQKEKVIVVYMCSPEVEEEGRTSAEECGSGASC
jgi:hypothetical protein